MRKYILILALSVPGIAQEKAPAAQPKPITLSAAEQSQHALLVSQTQTLQAQLQALQLALELLRVQACGNAGVPPAECGPFDAKGQAIQRLPPEKK